MTTSSVFSDRSYGHLGPSAEHDQIRQMIATALEKQSQIDEQIAHFKAILDDLYLQRQALDRYILEHRAMIAGIRQLPTELMQAVFRHCLPTRNVAMRSDEAPLLLGRVCSTWRQIAYATPQLWSSLHICLPRIDAINSLNPHMPPDDPVFQKLLQYGEAIEAWLHRASDIPLSISFSIKDHALGTWERDQVPQDIFAILSRFSRQWKCFAISDEAGILRFDMLSGREFPLLETLVLDVQTKPPTLHTPSLRSISLRFFYHWQWHYQWAQINQLTVGSWGKPSASSVIPSVKALDILRSCPQLISCTLLVDVREVPLDTGRARLPSLGVLRIMLCTTDWLSIHLNRDALAFFSRIQAPKLAQFTYKSFKELSMPFLSIFNQPNVIEAVEYSDRDIPVSLMNALALGPSIRRLRVVGIGRLDAACTSPTDHESFLTRLSLRPNHDSYICPSLEEIELELPTGTDLSDRTLLEFLLSRTDRAPPGAKRLRRARVVLQRRRTTDILPNLSQAIQRGLQIEIIYSPVKFQVKYSPSSELHLAVDPAERNQEFWPST